MKQSSKIALGVAAGITILLCIRKRNIGIGTIPGYRKAQKIRIDNTIYDRRQKLSEEDKKRMRVMREKNGLSYQQLADLFGVSKRLAIFVCNPDIYERVKKMNAERHASGRYDPTKEEWAKTMRDHRNYKAGLYFEGKIR